MDEIERRLARLGDAGADLRGGLKGLEKESLRITPDGAIARTPHSPALGSALTHAYITTDFSEALPELRTAPLADTRAVLAQLHELHALVYEALDDELLWAASMPCRVQGKESVPIAQYGTSNVGRMKHLYRVGLAHRYGSVMQAIAGVHFNYSLPGAFWPAYQRAEGDTGRLADFVSERYFGLVRNFQRLGWLVCYLYGSSPAVDRSFLGGCEAGLEVLDADTCVAPFATSLRMSDVGYTNKAQANLDISYDGLVPYVDGLTHATSTSYPDFERIGVKVDGEYRQLSTNVLQIENEFYSFIRPKQPIRSGEKPSCALMRRGVQYVEVRALDLDPYEPTGVAADELYFLEPLLIYCLLADSRAISAAEQREIDANQRRVTRRGRDPGLVLERDGMQVPLTDWGIAVLDAMAPICRVLDAGTGRADYTEALARMRERMCRPERTPSARVLAELRVRGESFCTMTLRLSAEHARYFRAQPLPESRRRHYAALAEESLARQRQMEASDTYGFEEYLARYFSQRA